MKTQLIKLQDNYIIVSDEEIKGNDYQIRIDNFRISKGSDDVIDGYKRAKIIAGIPELPQIDFSDLSEDDCKKIGWVDVEKLAYKECQSECIVDEYGKATQDGIIMFEKGFRTAQSLNEKKYGLEDIEKALYGNLNKLNGERRQYINFNTLKEKLSQPKTWDIEVEVANNSIKITKIL